MQNDSKIQASLRLASLIHRYFNDGLDAKEQQELNKWLEADERNRALLEQLSNEQQRQIWLRQFRAYDLDEGMEAIQRKIYKHKIRYRRLLPYAAAAVVFIFAAGIVYLRFHRMNIQQNVATVNLPSGNDVPPGGNKAVLTLANGHTILLDSTSKGLLTLQGGTQVINTKSGQLSYANRVEKHAPAAISYNTLTTPNGGQYVVVLPDGSRVWLDAASSLKYPTAFTGNYREVQLTGEGYFEVVHNDKQPFIVKVKGIEIHDIGTSFNVKAYTEEGAVKTTLLEGSVKVVDQIQSVLLKPGEQAKENAQGIMEVTKVNAADAVAWKNGFFVFSNSDLKTVMRTLARWYDVQVTYDGNIPGEHFDGMIQRDLSLATVLKYLKKNGINFQIEGRRITISAPLG